MNKCVKCGSIEFTNEIPSVGFPFIKYLLCKCGNVMMKVGEDIMPTPEEPCFETFLLMEDAEKSFKKFNVPTKEEIDECCLDCSHEDCSNCKLDDLEEDSVIDEESEENIDKIMSFVKDILTNNGKDSFMVKMFEDLEKKDILKDIFKETEKQTGITSNELIEDMNELFNLFPNEVKDNIEDILKQTLIDLLHGKSPRNHFKDTKTIKKSYAILEKGGGWYAFEDVTKEELAEKINNLNLKDFKIVETYPVQFEQCIRIK